MENSEYKEILKQLTDFRMEYERRHGELLARIGDVEDLDERIGSLEHCITELQIAHARMSSKFMGAVAMGAILLSLVVYVFEKSGVIDKIFR